MCADPYAKPVTANQNIAGQYVGIGGDFGRVFDPEDYLTMINAIDEATVILRAHLVLEEFLNIWASRITKTDDLFDGTFVQFKTKLVICCNLGFDIAFAEVIDKINDIRNRYSHRRKYKIEDNALNALRVKVNELKSAPELLPCEEFELFTEGADQNGMRKQVAYTWTSSDTKKRLTVIQVILVLKLVQWMQAEFHRRNITYNLVVWPATLSSDAIRA